MRNSKLQIGYNAFWNSDSTLNGEYFLKQKKCADFIFCHYDFADGDTEQQYESARKMADTFKTFGVDFIANIEKANFDYDVKTTDGHSWTEHPDGTHRFEFSEEMIDALNSQNNLIGVSYDEFEHCIINRNLSLRLSSKGKRDIPVFR